MQKYPAYLVEAVSLGNRPLCLQSDNTDHTLANVNIDVLKFIAITLRQHYSMIDSSIVVNEMPGHLYFILKMLI